MGLVDPVVDLRRGLRLCRLHQLFVLDPGQLGEEVDTVQKRPTDPLLGPVCRVGRAGALKDRVRVEPARAFVRTGAQPFPSLFHSPGDNVLIPITLPCYQMA